MQKCHIKPTAKKEHLFIVREQIQEGSREHACPVTQFFCYSVHACESAAHIDFGVTHKFQQAGEFSNMDSGNKEDPLYLPSAWHTVSTR